MVRRVFGRRLTGARVHAWLTRLGAILFLIGVCISIVGTLLGRRDAFELATTVLMYPGLLLVLGTVAVGDLALLWNAALAPAGRRAHWFVWVFALARFAICALWFKLLGAWEIKLVTSQLGA